MNKKSPQLYHEKIFWLLYHTDVSRWGELADKYAVRKFVTERIGKDILPKLLGVYDKAAEINFDELPQSFVLKTNNACTTNIIVHDKSTLDIPATRKRLDYWLGIHYGDLTAERQYTLIPPKIICEEMLQDHKNGAEGLIDYKFECFDGVPMFCTVYSERTDNTHSKKYMMYNMDWEPMPRVFDKAFKKLRLSKPIPVPECWNEMKEIAAKLSKGFTYVRVDMYVIDGKPVFGEMSFTPGFDTYYTEEFNLELGKLIKLPVKE
ncbi:MAG: hypothetical protein K2I69_00140 [Muribaculaceae bacterium]|nr:hypothetical protein [Muribaculaceae bacterium]